MGCDEKIELGEIFPDACFGVDPDCLLDQYHAFLDAYVNRMLFSESKYQRVKEIWQAVSFAKYIKVRGYDVQVKVVNEATDADVMLLVNGDEYPFQLTVAFSLTLSAIQSAAISSPNPG